jgi:hypothetical protein
MSNLKPIGSEKLSGENKLKRIMEIARYNEVKPSKLDENATSEYSVSLADGNNYEIVRERQGYIIKKTISESETDYIEPMKNRKYYSSYSQAFKRLNLVAGELNRLNENEEGVSLYGEQKKFTLRTPTPKAELDAQAPVAAPPVAPPAVPTPELPPSPNPEMGDEDVEGMGSEDMGIEPSPEDMCSEDMGQEGGEEKGGDDEEVSFKTIQKLTGKLTQKIRVLDGKEGMTSEDIKYVINMVLSSLELGSLSEEDKDDILSKFETEEEGSGDEEFGSEDMGDEEGADEVEGEEMPPAEDEMEESDYGHGAIFDSIFKESNVDKVISKYFQPTKKEIKENKELESKRVLIKKSEVKFKMESVVKLTETIEQELSSKRFLSENLNSKFIGKTNKNNLIFENKGKQYKITPEGLVI